MANPLREAVKGLFYPFAESKGFARAKSTHPHFTRFTRVDRDVVHVFDVQWDKDGRQSFVINFGEAAAGPSAGSIATHECSVRCRLVPVKDSPDWWGLTRPWREIIRTGRLRYKPAEVVDRVVVAFADVEAWWAEKHEGSHVHIVWRRDA